MIAAAVRCNSTPFAFLCQLVAMFRHLAAGTSPHAPLQVPVMFIQCRGPEARTAASFSIARQREAIDSVDEAPSSNDAPAGRGRERGRATSNADSITSSGTGGGGYSYFNAAETAVVVECVQQLLAAGMQPEDLCVITPYRYAGVLYECGISLPCEDSQRA